MGLCGNFGAVGANLYRIQSIIRCPDNSDNLTKALCNRFSETRIRPYCNGLSTGAFRFLHVAHGIGVLRSDDRVFLH